MAHKPLTIHASLIAIDGAGVLILGDPGAGKSDLALRLIDEGARLVADDRVEPFLAGGRLMGRAPAAIAGLLEARGAGIARLAHLGQCPIRLAVLLVGRGEIDRLPEPKAHVIEGLAHPPIPAVCLVGFDASATARVRLVLGQLKKKAGVKKKARGRSPSDATDAPGIWDFSPSADRVVGPARPGGVGARRDRKTKRLI